MGVVITRDDIISYAEVNYIIHHMNVRYLEMLPTKLVDFFDKMKDPYCEVYVDPHKPLQSQGLRQYTLEIIALLHLKYWCEDEERKQELYHRMEVNQIKFEEKIKERFNVENIFEDTKKEEDLKKEDYSKPKKINIISNLTNKNSNKENNVDENTEKEEKTNQIAVEKNQESFFVIILNKFKQIFKR